MPISHFTLKIIHYTRSAAEDGWIDLKLVNVSADAWKQQMGIFSCKKKTNNLQVKIVDNNKC